MRKIFLFSGTTEGRTLSDMLAKAEIPHIVCVATDYGKDMMEENVYVTILVGRMDEAQMQHLFTMDMLDAGNEEYECLVIDATHPYATEVTDNLKQAARAANAEYIRVLRNEAKVEIKDCKIYEDIASCASAMSENSGNILLTTGSKELGRYMEIVSKETKEKTYVRVLPSTESIRMCESLGVRPDHIIAMHGPFSKELNTAILKQYDIRHLITKDGGVSGGFQEKIEAAQAAGTFVHVIERPVTEEGVGVIEAFKMVTGNASYASRITLIGMGMGNTSGLTIEAADAINNADMIFGAERLLKNIECRNKIAKYRAEDIIPILEEQQPNTAVIVFSGDTGFYSGAKGMEQKLRAWRQDCNIRTLPGISSVSYLAAKLSETYENAVLFSLHGKNSERDIHSLVDKVKHNSKVFALLSGAEDVRRIAEKLLDFGIEAEIIAGENLSYANERIRKLSLKEASEFEGEGVISLMIINDDPIRRSLIPVKNDEDFIREKIPMTKECIRHESLIRLGLREGDIFYDIGGGTGSVAIEAAGLDPSLCVITIEKKEDAADLIQRNIKHSGLSNISLIEGAAEDALPNLGKPDCVFIGGNGGKLSKIISILHEKGDGIRFVINAVSLETIEQTRRVMEEYGIENEKITMLSVTDVAKTGDYHMLKAQNPVWVFSFTL